MRRLLSIIILISAIALAFYLFVIRSDSTLAAWYDANWGYRKSMTLSRASGTVSNYQMKVQVNKTSTATLVPSTGSEYVFNAGTTSSSPAGPISSALDSTHFVAVYSDESNSFHGTAIIGTVSGSTISYGSEYVFNAAATYFVSVSALDSTHFVAIYQDDANSEYGTAIIGTVSGSTISYGSEYVFNAGITYYSFVSALDSTHFVAVYEDAGNSNYGTAIIGTVSGSTISYGSEYVFNAGIVQYYISVSALDSTHFVVGYRDNSNSNYGTAIIGTVSGSTISYGSEYVFNAAATNWVSVSALDSTHFVVAYRDVTNSGYATAIIGTVSGDAISYGSEYVFNAADTYYVSGVVLDSTHFVATYQDDGNSSYGTAIIGTVSGSTISYSSESVFNAAEVGDTFVSALDSAHFVVAYRDFANSNYGTAVIGSVPNYVYLGSNVQDDFDDLRFTTSNGTTLLDYWIESYDAASATVWVEFDSIGTGATTFYMYYGNASATAVSSGANTFIQFDDFERGNTGDSVGGNWTVLSGSAKISTAQAWGGTRSLKIGTGSVAGEASIPVTASENIEVRFRSYKGTDDYLTLIHGNGTKQNYWLHRSNGAGNYIAYYNGSTNNTGQTVTNNAWQNAGINNINYTGGTYNLIYSSTGTDLSTVSGGGNVAMNTGAYGNNIFYLNGGAGGDSYVDNFIVRNWRSVEPVWGTWASEEPAPTPTPTPTPTLTPTPTITPTPTPTPTPTITPTPGPSFETNKLIGRWRFDGNTKDSTPYGNNGTATSVTLTIDRKDQVNKAYSFNGSSSYVNIGNNSSLNFGNSVTITVWIKANDLSSRHGIFSTRTSNSAGSFQLEVGTGNGGTNRVGITTPGVWNLETNDNAISTGTWYHIAYTRNGFGTGTQKLYVNGVLQTLLVDSEVAFIDNADNKVIGQGTGGGQFFNGLIDDVRIFSNALSQTSITKIYESYNEGDINFSN